MDRTVLIITTMDGAENLARAISSETHAVVEIARNRRSAVARLRRDPVAAVLLDARLSTAEKTDSDAVWQNAGWALPLELDLSSLGIAGTVRILRNLLDTSEKAVDTARQQAAADVEQQIHTTITTLLLESDLLLRDTALPPKAAEKARAVKDLAAALRTHLRSQSGERFVANAANRPRPAGWPSS